MANFLTTRPEDTPQPRETRSPSLRDKRDLMYVYDFVSLLCLLASCSIVQLIELIGCGAINWPT